MAKFPQLFLITVFWLYHSAAIPVSEFYAHHAFLDGDRKFELYWKSSGDWITFECHVNTLGYISLGFSPNGGMGGADIVVGGTKNGQGYLYVSSGRRLDYYRSLW